MGRMNYPKYRETQDSGIDSTVLLPRSTRDSFHVKNVCENNFLLHPFFTHLG